MGKPTFYIRDIFLDFFEKYQKMVIGDMFFRLYNPQKDSVVGKYSKEDWNQIFMGVTEAELKELSSCINVIILLWCDIKTEDPHGMLYFEESHLYAKEVLFHGGTWDHSPKYFVQIYHSIICVFRFLLDIGAIIRTTCMIDNKRADKFQKSLCMVETKRDEHISYKTLNREKFDNSIFIQRINHRQLYNTTK